MLRKTAHFAQRALSELHRSEGEWLRNWDDRPALPPGYLEAVPAPPKTAHGLASITRRIARRGLQKLLYRDQWFIAYRFSTEDRWYGDLRLYTSLVPPADRLWADPFPVERNGRHFIFFEELVFARGKGHIAVVEVDRNGVCGTPLRVLERDYHLSYPFLFEHGGELFMIPETGDNRTVELYRCVAFPHRWQLEKVLLSGSWFTDATLYNDGYRWWMFVNVGIEGGEAHDELHLYYAHDPLGQWLPHSCNPVKSDVRSARPAGRLYRLDGDLFRPSQICAPLYGSGVSLNRITTLTTEAFAELEQECILPVQPKGLLGIHTLNRAGELCVVDGFTRRRRAGIPGGPVRVLPPRPLSQRQSIEASS